VKRKAPLKRTPPKWQRGEAAPLKRTMKRSTPLRTRGNARTRAGQVRLEAAKAEVRGRSGGWCEASTPACPPDRHRATQAHHRLPRSQGGKHDPDNLLDVCTPAHDWIHANPAASYDAGWLAHRGAS
jgi:hypothetical protein